YKSQAEALQRVVDRPEVADRQEAALTLQHPLRSEAVSPGCLAALDVAEHLAVGTGHPPQAVVQLDRHDAGNAGREGRGEIENGHRTTSSFERMYEGYPGRPTSGAIARSASTTLCARAVWASTMPTSTIAAPISCAALRASPSHSHATMNAKITSEDATTPAAVALSRPRAASESRNGRNEPA